MLKKGFVREESPEKMPSKTTGIILKRSDVPSQRPKERLAGGNEAADESLVSQLVTEYIQGIKR